MCIKLKETQCTILMFVKAKNFSKLSPIALKLFKTWMFKIDQVKKKQLDNVQIDARQFSPM